ncbi:hypothetical protein SAMN05421766_11617 [Zobellia uliginosa]|uniref:Uncharacterized protein n=1 Tax=Zobellia uliginosa TaxID=143224 RepID=A0ABY1L279_9FLAO|nr:hypothetical protein SAMN05421766_11617 [Zobellia uliginosa]
MTVIDNASSYLSEYCFLIKKSAVSFIGVFIDTKSESIFYYL